MIVFKIIVKSVFKIGLKRSKIHSNIIHEMIKPGTQQAETGQKVQGQPGLHSETLSQKKKQKNKTKVMKIITV
jgi:hypothetical protein